MDFKWRLLLGHMTHAMGGHEAGFNQENNSSFTMNLLTMDQYRPLPSEKQKACTACITLLLMRHLLHAQTSTDMLAALSQSSQPNT